MADQVNSQAVLKQILTGTVILLFFGTGAYFLTEDNWAKSLFVHLGALGLISLIGFFSGTLAEKKKYRFMKSYLLAVSIPIVLGGGSALLWPLTDRNSDIPCGGSIALVTALLILGFFSAIKPPRNRRNKNIADRFE